MSWWHFGRGHGRLASSIEEPEPPPDHGWPLDPATGAPIHPAYFGYPGPHSAATPEEATPKERPSKPRQPSLKLRRKQGTFIILEDGRLVQVGRRGKWKYIGKVPDHETFAPAGVNVFDDR